MNSNFLRKIGYEIGQLGDIEDAAMLLNGFSKGFYDYLLISFRQDEVAQRTKLKWEEYNKHYNKLVDKLSPVARLIIEELNKIKKEGK